MGLEPWREAKAAESGTHLHPPAPTQGWRPERGPTQGQPLLQGNRF